MKKPLSATIIFHLILAAVPGISFAESSEQDLPETPSRVVVAEKELLITDLAVVNSELAQGMGPFSFGGLCERMASPEKAPRMVKEWLYTWMKDQTVNGAVLPARTAIYKQVIQPWIERDLNGAWLDGEWVPNLKNAPFRLLAIVNRVDLGVVAKMREFESAERSRSAKTKEQQGISDRPLPRGVAGLLENKASVPYYGEPNRSPLLAAQGRFVFCATNAAGDPLPGGFTVILEYSLINGTAYKSLHDWAVAWHALGAHEKFDDDYLNALNQLTDEFTGWATRKAPLLTIRTSEKCFSEVREMREFTFSDPLGWTPSLMASTPLPQFEDQKALANLLLGSFLASRGESLFREAKPFPRAFQLEPSAQKILHAGNEFPLFGANCQVPETTPLFRWQFQNLKNENLRQRFSLQTCNGCHAGETDTPDGFHIKPRNQLEAAKVSPFLEVGRQLSVKSPDGTKVAYFNEMTDRIGILSALAEKEPGAQKAKIKAIARNRVSLQH